MDMKLLGLLGVLALAGCNREDRAGSDAGNQAASAQGQAEDGRVTVKAPGVDISVRLPDAVRNRMSTDGNNQILPPNVRIGGVHVQGDGSEGGSGGNGAVDLTFRSDQAPDQLAAWYRDPQRAQHFTIASDAREGAAIVIGGATRGSGGDGGGRFTVRLSPGQGGGTEGRLSISERS